MSLRRVTVLALLLLMVACGAPSASSGPTAITSPAPTAAVATNVPATAAATSLSSAAATAASTLSPCQVASPAAPTTVTLLGNKFPIMEFYATQLQQCSHDNVTVAVKWLAGREKVLAETEALTATTSPYDIIQTFDGPFVEYASKGLLYDLTPLVEKYRTAYDLNDIPQDLWRASSYQGKIYGFPLIQNMQIMFYRTDVFSQLGLKPPQTYAELLKVSKTIADAKLVSYPYAAVWKQGNDLAAAFSNYLQSIGGEWFADTTPTFNGPKGVEAVTLMQQMMPYMSPQALTMNTDDVMTAFQKGEVAMVNLWITRAARINDPSQSTVVGRVGYAPAPALVAGGVPGGTWARDMYVLPKNLSHDPDLVFRLVLEATTAERQTAGATLALVSRTSAATSPQALKVNQFTDAVQQALKQGALGFPVQPAIGIAHTAVGTTLPDALTGKTPIADALNAAAEQTSQRMRAGGDTK